MAKLVLRYLTDLTPLDMALIFIIQNLQLLLSFRCKIAAFFMALVDFLRLSLPPLYMLAKYRFFGGGRLRLCFTAFRLRMLYPMMALANYHQVTRIFIA
jgi:hypothetical protein